MQNLGGQTKSIMVFSEVAYLDDKLGCSDVSLASSYTEQVKKSVVTVERRKKPSRIWR